MKNIRKWFESDGLNNGQRYDFSEYKGHLEVKNNTILFMIVEPHSNTENKWMLRIAPFCSFDEWANSTAVEKSFDTDIELCNYLHKHQLDIYKAILERLTDDYDSLYHHYN